MNRATRSFVFALLAFAAATWLVCNPRRPSETPSAVPSAVPSAAAAKGAASATQTEAAPAAPSASSAPSRGAAVGFRNTERLAEHFEKHGAEFNAPSREAYLAMAQALRDAPPGPEILELVRPADGVVNRFDKKTGAFIAYDPDGTIRTFFKPNDGEAYFRRQARRAPR
jgi:pyocin large subunit-like protein